MDTRTPPPHASAADPAAHAPPPLPTSDRPAPTAGLQRRLAPYLRQAWLNFQVWAPPLMNPPTRAREVVYWARQHRERGIWQIALPPQCCECAAQRDLREVDYEFEVRSFDNALVITLGLGGLLAVMLLLSAVMTSFFLFCLTLALGVASVGLLWVKSWKETVHVVLHTCPQHADALACPEAVVEQEELHLLVANEGLAAATRTALKEERRGRAPQHTEASPTAPPRPRRDDAAATAPPPPPPPSPYARTPRPELPPIKLDGDE